MKRRRDGSVGQGTLEYILLAAAVIVALLFGINKYIRGGAQQVVNDSGSVINGASANFTNGMTLK